ncbi:MAG: SulP family inorganic anion transporter [Bacteroides sp.]
MQKKNWFDFSPKLFDTLKNYSARTFAQDAMSGIIVGIVALPLAIAFGIASGVSPEVGIFTAILGGFIVSLLGGSNVQIGGPTGAFIVIVYGIIQRYGIDGLIVATFMAGVLLIVMGALKLGTLIKFIPYPIIVGFTAGIAITIFSTQINDLFGLGLTQLPGDFLGKWGRYLGAFTNVSLLPFLFGIASILIIAFTPRLSKKIPGSLVAIVLLSLLAFLLKHFAHLEGLECIGDRYTIQTTLPRPVFPTLSIETVRELFPSAFTIALLGAIESLLSASVADGVTGDRHRSNTELIAQGAANLVVPIFGGIPVTGAIARTMTNINNGGKTPVAGLIHAIVLLLLLLFLGPLMDYIPMAVLAGVLVIVSYNMSGWRSIVGILRGPRADIAVMVVTFALTVLLDLTVAIEIGLLLAMLIFMRRMIESVHIKVSEDTLHLDLEEQKHHTLQHECINIPKGVEVYEIEGPFFFGIANQFEEAVTAVGRTSRVRIVRMRFVSFMDSTGLHNLTNLVRICKMNRVHLILSGVNTTVLHTLLVSGLLQELGQENVLPNIHLALQRAQEVLDKEEN